MRRISLAVVVWVASGAALAQSQDCRSIADSLERLRCYDAREDAVAGQPAPSPVAEDPLIVAAKAAVRKLLRDPTSTRFEAVKIATDRAGKKAVCGRINSRNAMDGMTGPKLFVFDGKYARILVAAEGPEDGTSLGRYLLGAMLGEGLKLHDQFCKV
jgi:hypothetical protein